MLVKIKRGIELVYDHIQWKVLVLGIGAQVIPASVNYSTK